MKQLFFSRFFTEVPEQQTHKADTSTDHPARAFTPFVDPVEEYEIHVDKLQADREKADDEEIYTESTHGQFWILDLELGLWNNIG
jgi:hypothetical protein